MASILGFQLKNFKPTKSTDYTNFVATMYLNGKKIGTYADYGDGGCEEVKFVSKEAEQEMWKVIVAFANKYPNQGLFGWYNMRPQRYREAKENFIKTHPYIPKEDVTVTTMAGASIVFIVGVYLNLLEYEKAFKQYQNKGCRAISVKEDSVHAYPADWTDEQIRKASEGRTLYMSLDDFVM